MTAERHRTKDLDWIRISGNTASAVRHNIGTAGIIPNASAPRNGISRKTQEKVYQITWYATKRAVRWLIGSEPIL